MTGCPARLELSSASVRVSTLVGVHRAAEAQAGWPGPSRTQG